MSKSLYPAGSLRHHYGQALLLALVVVPEHVKKVALVRQPEDEAVAGANRAPRGKGRGHGNTGRTRAIFG